ncbi:unnamed protein product, partial [Callosobruchus maculatus]
QSIENNITHLNIIQLQILLVTLCSSLLLQGVTAVVNNGPAKKDESSILKADTSNRSNTSTDADTTASSTNEKGNRREASATLLDTYGPPVSNSYFPTGGSHLNLPVPVYGAPNVPTNNLVYPATPPVSVPILPTYGAPVPVYGPPVSNHLHSGGHFSSPISFGDLKSHSHYKGSSGKLRFQYGPPGKPYFGKHRSHVPFKSNKFGKPSSDTYAFTSGFKDAYKPNNLKFNFNSGHGFMTQANVGSFGGLSTQYGLPLHNAQTKIVNLPTFDSSFSLNSISGGYGVPELQKPIYGPPQISPRPRPPHLGIPAPPTPPDIKYDGWQPILGLFSKPPQNTYLPAQTGDIGSQYASHGDIGSQHGAPGPLALDKFHSSGVKDSYGAPLNTVTGSGGVVMATGNDYANKRPHNDEDHHDGAHNHLNVGNIASSLGLSQDIQAVKSIGYEIFPGGTVTTGQGSADTYNAPPPSSYPPPGLYAAEHSYIGGGAASSHFGHGLSISHSGTGLVPPSGVYGVPPGGRYGTPLMFPQKPTTLTNFAPPAITIAKPFREYGPPSSNNEFGFPPGYSLQSVNVLPSSDFNFHLDGAVASGLTGYNAPSGFIDSSYAQSENRNVVGLDFSLPGVTVDLTKGYDSLTSSSNLNSVSDCSYKHSSYNEDAVPSFSKNTVEPIDPLDSQATSYNVTESDVDQTGAQSLQHQTEIKANATELENSDNAYARSVAEHLVPNSELLKSQQIDISNLPIHNNTMSYSVQIQSSDGKSTHGDVLNEELLQSILAAIEQPSKGHPIVQLQKSVEKQNFVTNGSLSSVVGQLTDAEIRHTTQLAKEAIEKTSENFGESSLNEFVIMQSSASDTAHKKSDDGNEENKDNEKQRLFLEDNGIALYFNKNARTKTRRE